MEGFIVFLAVLFLLSVPIMLIVSLVKLSSLKAQIRRIEEKMFPQQCVEETVAAEEQEQEEICEEVPLPKETVPEVFEEKSPIVCEPTALELFWARIEDWIAVRGAFAPAGMTREFAFATRWLLRIGVLLLVGAVIYFVKLSVDQGWMGPVGRVVSTVLWGAVFSAVGTWLVLKEKYALLGHALSSLGIVALYLGFGLGHKYFDPPVIASPVFAFISLFAVTVVAGIMSVVLKSSHIAVMGLVGGYLVPVLAGRDSGFPLGLDVYLLIVNLGAFFAARFRKWPLIDFLAATLAFIVCCVWSNTHSAFGGKGAILVNFAFLSAVHALYVASVMIGARGRSKAGNAIAWSGLAVNACCYFYWLAWVFRAGFSGTCAGLVLLALVAVYLSLAVVSIRKAWADRETINIILFFALAFLAVTPLLLFSRPWCVFSWAALAVATAEAESQSKRKLLGIVSYLLLGAAALAGLFYYAPMEYCNYLKSSLLNLSDREYLTEFALRFVRLWSLPVAAVLVARKLKINFLAIAAYVTVFLFYTGESRIFGYVFFPMMKTGTVSVAWFLVAFAGLWAGIALKIRTLRICALSLLAVTVGKVLLIDTERLTTPVRVGIFALAGGLLIVGAFLYLKFKDRFKKEEQK
jgi:uncharacterized membrane protein